MRNIDAEIESTQAIIRLSTSDAEEYKGWIAHVEQSISEKTGDPAWLAESLRRYKAKKSDADKAVAQAKDKLTQLLAEKKSREGIRNKYDLN